MQLKTVTEKSVYGLSIRTDNATEIDPNKAKIGGLYQTFDQTIAVDYANGERVYGVYYDYESDHSGQFNVLAGFNGKNLSDSALEKVIIPEARYLVFTQTGKMPDAVINAWKEVWQYFASDEADHTRLFTTDFEFYESADKVELYIAVK
ncbi:GyrI-like domain-containing protein [Psychromonas aquatilis]|uniref:GyrI-like domain-containing protein n=1 Tax=Psychromonas aquatilis TaxID=2005072 RepID=A0ABU9GM34_9GAMM